MKVPANHPLGMVPSDAAKRCSDEITFAVLAGNVGRWIAIRLSDGGSDARTYDTKAEAVRFQFHENFCCYILVPADGMPPADAERFLQINRDLYANGARLADPEAPTIHMPSQEQRFYLP